MLVDQRFEGVLVPVVTPFAPDLSPDAGRFLALCQALIADGADGLAIFGTTSEANSIGAVERMALLEMLLENGVPARLLMPGVGATAMDDVVRLMRHAAQLGCGGALLLPPFYYKGVSDDGLFDFVAAVLSRTEGSKLDVYLYHIPPVAQVGFSPDLVGRLIDAFPDRIVGLKDSSGDFTNTRTLIERFPGFRVFSGSEVFLLDTLRAGGAGCITATGSVNITGIRQIYSQWRSDSAVELQQRAAAIRSIIQSYPVIPALKAIIANSTGDPAWRTVRPPLQPLDEAQSNALINELKAAHFQPSSGVIAMGRKAEAAAG
jgi:4-hydroxy-tetrahydrodipicolinate synthase